jgi:hypothetical protein
MVLLFDAGTRTWRIRFLTLLFIAGIAGAIWLGVADDDLVLGAWLAVFALAFSIGMVYYGTIYVSSLWLIPGRKSLCVETLTLFGRARRYVPLADCRGGTYNDVSVRGEHAPWFTLNVRGRRVPFVIDAQGTIHDASKLQRVLTRGARA